MAKVGGREQSKWYRPALFRLALLIALWWTLTDGGAGWYFGLPLAIVATLVSLWLTPPAVHRLRLPQLPVFALYFIRQSLLAGWDVAGRTLSPNLPLQPALLEMPLKLPDGAPTWWLMITISLLPGTLSVQLDGRTLTLHCLDAGQDVEANVRQAEHHIAALFGAAQLTESA